MRILFACGGTGGHINPGIAVADQFKKMHPEAEILFAGNPRGMEARLVPAAGYPFKGISVLGFQRRITLHNFVNNVQAVYLLALSGRRAEKLIKDFQPDVVVGTGGYVSGPVLRKAAKLGFKTVSHEQNAYPGVTTKLLSNYVDEILLTVTEAQKYLNPKCKTVVTGNPVRQEFFFLDRKRARSELGIPDDKFCILSYGGSNGAQRVNEVVAEFIEKNRGDKRLHHIHATGSIEKGNFLALLSKKGIKPNDAGLDIREYINDMPRCYAAADLIICRAGFSTLAELQAAGRASILIPSPNVSENHQYHNAMTMKTKDAAVLIVEKDFSLTTLQRQVDKFLNTPGLKEQFEKNARAMSHDDATERIYEEIMRVKG